MPNIKYPRCEECGGKLVKRGINNCIVCTSCNETYDHEYLLDYIRRSLMGELVKEKNYPTKNDYYKKKKNQYVGIELINQIANTK